MANVIIQAIADPGHAWLMVGTPALEAAGLTPADFSTYSYRNPDVDWFALEEDCDMPLFLEAYTAATGNTARIEVTHVQATPIRSWPSINQGDRT